MNILVVGGSNSLLKNGYVQHLEQALAARMPVTVRQLSVGATSSLAAIGRLFETAGNMEVDVILYEYSINDAGHFAWRPDGGASWLLCLHLLIKAAAQLYPNAVFVPLVFAMQRFASPAVRDPFYDFQVEWFARLGLSTIDVRRWLADLFLDHPPAWLYGDEAHYATPQATALIGCEIARRLLVARTQDAPLSAIWERLQTISPHGSLEMAYVPAAGLAQFVSGPAELMLDGNRLMQLTFLRMREGSTLALRTEMFPLALYLKSDAQHDSVRLSLESAGVSGTVTTGTRHVATDALRFVCCNVPVPLLFGHQLAVSFGTTAFEIAMTPGTAAPVANFDCFGMGIPAPDRHFDLCGILFVARAA
ncbi:SGNH/GDSL hydrolase family protein [Massilia rhizosphaerae]|uniref:SGNH/GDSL hydrolase family protein n=1 Tax=Massilia rhizosphaerae TaxID=2784389 RepID=UPI0018DB624A|nr:SGNH/GDSL hydrolase family protein [Massilia rhizosphaerae]